MSSNNDNDSTYSRQGWPNPTSHRGRDGGDQQDEQKLHNSSFGPYVFGSLVFFIAILGACPFVLRRFGCVSAGRRRRRAEYAVGENDGSATTGVDRHKLVGSSLITTKVISHGVACGMQRSEEDQGGDKTTHLQTSHLESGKSSNHNKDQHHSGDSDGVNNNRDLDTFVNQKYSPPTTGEEEGQSSTPTPEVKDDGRNGDSNGILCHICLECLQVGDNVSWAASSTNSIGSSTDGGENETCQHVFHNKCIVEWLRRHDDCPCCRRAVLQTSRIHVPASGDESASVGDTARRRIEADDMDEEKGNYPKSGVDEKYVFCVVHGIVHKGG